MNEFIIGLLSKAYNMTDVEVAETFFSKTDDDKLELKNDALEIALSKDAERVSRLKGDSQGMFDKGYQKGQKESLSRLEKDFIETTGFESELQGLELFTAYADTLKNAKTKLSDDEFKLDKRYIEAERAWKKKVDENINLVKEEYEGKLNEFTKKEKFSKIKNDAKSILSEMNPILSENQKIRDNQLGLFLKLFENGYDYELSEDRNHVIIDNGKRLEDAHGNMITFDNYVKSKAKDYFEFKVQDKKSGTGNDGVKKDGFQFKKFESEREYMEAMKSAPDAETRKQIFETFNTQEK